MILVQAVRSQQRHGITIGISTFEFDKKKKMSSFRREPMSMIDVDKYVQADEETRQKMLEAVTPTATRNILLIRHAQCDRTTDRIGLTLLGIEQAKLLAKRLSEISVVFDKCVYSPVLRAEETAKFIIEQTHPKRSYPDSLLEEGTPPPPEPPGHLSSTIPKHVSLWHKI